MKKLVIASITAILLSSPMVSNAANACKGIKFAVNNQTGATIKLWKVQYANVSRGKTRTESFPTLQCLAGRICKTTVGQNLRNARNDQLDNFEFAYQILLPGTTNWSAKYRTATFSVNNATCIANRTYGGGHWKITPYPIINW